jgi:hypothetical protein
MTCRAITRRLTSMSPLHVATYSVGGIELRPAKLDMPGEQKAIDASRLAYHEGIDDAMSMRVAVIVDEPDELAALETAEVAIDEALDLVTAQSPTRGMTRYRLLESGCVRNLDTGRVTPILPRIEPRPFNSFHMPPSTFPSRDLAQLVLSDATDLGDRYVRAAHWSRKAEFESNRHIATLFEWFAAETVWTLARDTDIIPSVLWTWGFANGQGAKLISARTQTLVGLASYRQRRQQAQALLEQLRTLRNSIVHNGFRLLDIKPHELSVHASVARMAGRGALQAAQEALVSGFRTASEAAEYLPIAMEPDLIRTSENVVRILKGAGASIT